MSSLSLPALISLIAVALAFDFLNGLHDTANSIATLVSTRMLRPRYAVMWAAFFNFIAFLVFGVHVARTIGVGIVSADVMDAQVIFGALTGAILWNLITWWAGIPSSSSHALIGGLVGAGLTKAGVSAIVWTGLLTTGAFIVLSPLFGFLRADFAAGAVLVGEGRDGGDGTGPAMMTWPHVTSKKRWPQSGPSFCRGTMLYRSVITAAAQRIRGETL
jgi:phosphate/sulfate permease